MINLAEEEMDAVLRAGVYRSSIFPESLAHEFSAYLRLSRFSETLIYSESSEEQIKEFKLAEEHAKEDRRLAEERAEELLFEFLSEEQKEQIGESWVIERGYFGIYRIPLSRNQVRFEATDDPKKFLEFRSLLRGIPESYLIDAITSKNYSLCFMDMGFIEKAPWHDTVVTLLLTIRAGKEKKLWEKAGLTPTFDYIITPTTNNPELLDAGTRDRVRREVIIPSGNIYFRSDYQRSMPTNEQLRSLLNESESMR